MAGDGLMSLLDDYQIDLQLRNLATVKGHVNAVRAWLAWCSQRGIVPLAISRDDLRAYLADHRQAGNKTTSIQSTFSRIAGFYEYLEDTGKYSGSAIRDIRYVRKTYLSPYKSDAETRQLISIEQASDMICRTIKTRDRAILAVLFFTGIRSGELISLDIGDVDLPGLTITLKPAGKRSNRTVFFSEECRQELQRWIRVRDKLGAEDKALFLGESRTRLKGSGVADVVKAAARRIGVHDGAGPLERKYTPHCCRHWFTTHLRRGGMPREFIQELRGDKRGAAIDIYDHIDMRELKKRYLECIPRLGI